MKRTKLMGAGASQCAFWGFFVINKLCTVFLLLLLVACNRPKVSGVQGYVEGEFVYVAAPLSGELQTLLVKRGQQVQAGQALFSLDNTAELAARDEAAKRLQQANAELADMQKGMRPEEIHSIEAQLQQARAALSLSEREASRQKKLFNENTVAEQEFDRARSQFEQDQQRVNQLQSQLQTAKLGARSDMITAKAASAEALEANLRRAEWDLSQKTQTASQAAQVFDTLYRQGEWVQAGHPAVVLLPPENIKVRVFLPQAELGGIHLGDKAEVHFDGASEDISGQVSFISPHNEYTPPVIFSQLNRNKLVFMVEVEFPSDAANKLHPGQPVDVDFQ